MALLLVEVRDIGFTAVQGSDTTFERKPSKCLANGAVCSKGCIDMEGGSGVSFLMEAMLIDKTLRLEFWNESAGEEVYN